MKIGILTLPLQKNYGGLLQAWSLQTTLERMGHEVYVFQKEYLGVQNKTLWRNPFLFFKRFLYKCLKDQHFPVFYEKKIIKELPTIRKHTNRFISNYIHTYPVSDIVDITNFCCGCDAIIVGSDQIWRPEYVRKMWNMEPQDAFLRFTDGMSVKRIAYAASFGVDQWLYNDKETGDCVSLARKFDAISIREESGVKLCAEKLGLDAKLVLDPTLLMSKEDYLKLIKDEDDLSGELFSYILDYTTEKADFVRKVSDDYKMKCFEISINNTNFSVPIKDRIVPPVERWLECFYRSKFVITDSFHGCVFSIIFNKPFIAIPNIDRGASRFLSLVKLFGIENNLLFDLNQYSNKTNYQIPESVKERLNYLRKYSLHFLSSSLS